MKGGRCEACQGDGVLRVEMHFLPDIFVTCDTCGGKRYNRETLEVQYRGLSIADALDAHRRASARAVRDDPARSRAARRAPPRRPRLPHARPAGDDALRRRSAAREARARARAQGDRAHALRPRRADHRPPLHGHRGAPRARSSSLRDQGNTVVVIEHNLDVVACADWVIDLGPEGGDKGGEIVAEGTPETIAKTDGLAHGPLPEGRPRPRDGEHGAHKKKRDAEAATPANAAEARIALPRDRDVSSQVVAAGLAKRSRSLGDRGLVDRRPPASQPRRRPRSTRSTWPGQFGEAAIGRRALPRDSTHPARPIRSRLTHEVATTCSRRVAFSMPTTRARGHSAAVARWRVRARARGRGRRNATVACRAPVRRALTHRRRAQLRAIDALA